MYYVFVTITAYMCLQSNLCSYSTPMFTLELQSRQDIALGRHMQFTMTLLFMTPTQVCFCNILCLLQHMHNLLHIAHTSVKGTMALFIVLNFIHSLFTCIVFF